MSIVKPSVQRTDHFPDAGQMVLQLARTSLTGSVVDSVRYRVYRFRMDAKRRNITQPSDLWAAIDKAAAKAGLPVSEWLGNAARAMLPDKVTAKLAPRKKPGRPHGDGKKTSSDS